MKTIDLSSYVTTGKIPGQWGAHVVLKGYATGQKIARDLDIKNMEGEQIALGVPFALGYIDPSFLSGMLRTLIKRQGIDATKELVRVPHDVQKWLDKFWEEEGVKEAKKAAKKAKEASLGQWANPMQFFVPDIGTRVRLTQDWTFRLHMESRNYEMYQLFGIPYGSGGRQIADMRFSSGTILKIDRMYIRKGVKDYSSITFNVEKGDNSIAQYGDNKHTFKKKGVRFWAKLSDVNKMVVEVDTATLSEN